MKFEEKLQKLRKASDITQEQLADKLGVSRQAVSKWESGASYPEMDKLIQMSKIFNCSLDDLVNDEETEKTIFKNQATKRNLYLDSFMEFITKSINMFSKMKFINLVKCVCELIIIGFIICMGIAFCSMLVDGVLDNVLFFSSNEVIWKICSIINEVLNSVVFIVLIIIGIIIFFQIYKIRYLDYYDKLMYEYEQRVELQDVDEKVDEKIEEIKVEKKNKENKRIKLEEKKKERIIIRDPEHRPFAFLSIFSNLIINIFKGCLLFLSLFFVFTLICGVISLVLAIYLVSINKLFMGIIIGIIGIIIFNLVILDWNFKYIYNFKVNIKRLFVISIVSIIISSVGAGVFIIGLKDIDFIEYGDKNEFKKVVEVIPSDQYINLTESIYHYGVTLVEDETKTDYTVSFEYNHKLSDYKIINENNEYRINFEYKINTIKEALDFTLEGIKNNEIRLFDLYGYHYMEIRSNRQNIENLVKYLRDEQNIIFVDMDNDGVYVLY